MTDLADAIAAADPLQLLPDRPQSRTVAITGPCRLIDALEAGEGACLALVSVAGRLIVVPGVLDDGVFRRAPVSARILHASSQGSFRIEVFGPLPAPDAPEHAIAVDQSNDSTILADEIVMKWLVDAVDSPAPGRLRALQGSGLTPSTRAIVEWTDPASGDVLTLGVASDLVSGARDGWEWAVELVRAHAQGAHVDPFEPFARIGDMTARMHLAFAADGIQTVDLTSEPSVLADARADLAVAVDLLDGDEGDRLRAWAPAIESDLERLADVTRTPAIPIHGDLHVGQVLQSPAGDLTFVDFDGSPVQSEQVRLTPQPAARDVAGMLASIDHVARVVNYRTEGLDPRPALTWIPHAQDAFLAAYQGRLSDAGQRSLLDDRLLAPFMLHQELREYVYSVRHLPHWRYVPDAVLTTRYGDPERRTPDTKAGH